VEDDTRRLERGAGEEEMEFEKETIQPTPGAEEEEMDMEKDTMQPTPDPPPPATRSGGTSGLMCSEPSLGVGPCSNPP
jgi:hypothetical protein